MKSNLVKSLSKIERDAIVLSIKVVDTSKIKDHLIYECIYLDLNQEKTVNIIAQDITQALAKLQPYVASGIPQNVIKQMLGNERFLK
jgi:type II secretory pathway predicted ATPase ExeA